VALFGATRALSSAAGLRHLFCMESRPSPAADAGSATEVQDYYSQVLPYLDIELADRGDGELWTAEAAVPAGCRVLELGCGTGRATAFLARTAGRVVGLDLSPELAVVARQRLRDRPQVTVLVADCCTLPLHPEARFDLIVAVDDPLVHLLEGEERDRAFHNVARHLAPDGRFLLEAAWLSPDRRHAAERTGGLVEERRASRGLTVRETWICEPETRRCTVSFEYLPAGRPTVGASFPARLWTPAEIKRRGLRAGLAVTALWGDYDRSPWQRATSPRLIAELRLAHNEIK